MYKLILSIFIFFCFLAIGKFIIGCPTAPGREVMCANIPDNNGQTSLSEYQDVSPFNVISERAFSLTQYNTAAGRHWKNQLYDGENQSYANTQLISSVVLSTPLPHGQTHFHNDGSYIYFLQKLLI